MSNQISDTVGEGFSFTRTSTGQNQERPRKSFDGVSLGGI